MSIVKKGRRIADRLRAQTWFESVDEDTWGGLEEIADAPGENLATMAPEDRAAEFDAWWSDFYDIADRERIWVKTIR